MPNTPGPAAQKRSGPTPRRNAQDDHEGAPQSPAAYDQDNPARVIPGGADSTGAAIRRKHEAQRQAGQDLQDPQDSHPDEAPLPDKANRRDWNSVDGDSD